MLKDGAKTYRFDWWQGVRSRRKLGKKDFYVQQRNPADTCNIV